MPIIGWSYLIARVHVIPNALSTDLPFWSSYLECVLVIHRPEKSIVRVQASCTRTNGKVRFDMKFSRWGHNAKRIIYWTVTMSFHQSSLLYSGIPRWSNGHDFRLSSNYKSRETGVRDLQGSQQSDWINNWLGSTPRRGEILSSTRVHAFFEVFWRYSRLTTWP